MKKLFVLAVAGVMAISATSAFAWGGHGRGMGQGCAMQNGNCVYPDDAYGFGGAVEQISADTAKANVQAYLDANLKGYNIKGVTETVNPRGYTLYTVTTADSNGNSFIFVVGPLGHVRGPILEKDYNAWQARVQQLPAAQAPGTTR